MKGLNLRYKLTFSPLIPGEKGRAKTRHYTDPKLLNADYHGYKAFFHLRGYYREGIRGKWISLPLPLSEFFIKFNEAK